MLRSFARIPRFASRYFTSAAKAEEDYLDPKEFVTSLKRHGINFFTGVPDSLLMNFCSYIIDNSKPSEHITAANEGNAIGIAAGYNLATQKTPCVYMQNSGIGNITNPILTLTHQNVYSIPMLIIVGWRGEPGKKDEPQHLIAGKLTGKMLENIDVPTCILPNYIEGANVEIEKAVQFIKTNSSPYGFIVKRNTFGDYEKKNKVVSPYPLNREDAIKCLLKYMGPHEPIVSTTGFTSRELYEVREKMKAGGRDFLCVGSMGHASSIAMGIALAKPSKKVYCFDGDGAVLMHMGSLAVVGNSTMDNFIHIVFNNGAHESVGGQPTVSQKIDISKIAKACGYKEVFKVSTEAEIKIAIEKCHNTHGPSMIEILNKIGTRKNLGRPKSSTYSNKSEFMKFLDE